MKLLLLCIAIVGSVAVKKDDELALMKRLLQALKQEDFAASHGSSAASDKRYLYQTPNKPSPYVLKLRPGAMNVDLQMDIDVMNKCPDCRVFVNFQCVGNECHNKAERRYPENGYTWAQFIALFVTPTKHEGVWLDGLESGMKYNVWDSVTLANTTIDYDGYENTERRAIILPVPGMNGQYSGH